MAKKILFLAANPKGTNQLRLDEEVREIQEGLLRSRYRDQFDLKAAWAVRSRDFYRYMLDIQPQIVHFSGHGGEEHGIVLEDESGKIEFLQTEQLAALFKLFASKGLECVMLNACYSEIQAKAINQHIPYVIGMNEAVGDMAAIKFSVAFYDALASGETVEFAFALGCTQLIGLKQDEIPVLLKRLTAPIESNVSPPPNPRELALELLRKLVPPQFETVIFKYGVDPGFLSTNVGQAQRAIEVIRYAEQTDGESLMRLLQVIYEVAPHFKR